MICDHLRCRNEPMRAPRVVVPSRTMFAPGHTALRMMTTQHYCERHKHEAKLADYLDSRVRAAFEGTARKTRPIDFVCDFDRAFVEFVLITTPEYQAWMRRVDIGALVRTL